MRLDHTWPSGDEFGQVTKEERAQVEFQGRQRAMMVRGTHTK